MSFNVGVVPLFPLIGKPVSVCNTQFRISIETYENLAASNEASIRIHAIKALPFFTEMVKDFIQMLNNLKDEVGRQIQIDSDTTLSVIDAMKNDPNKFGVGPSEVSRVYEKDLKDLKDDEERANNGVDIISLEISSTNSILIRCHALASKLGITL